MEIARFACVRSDLSLILSFSFDIYVCLVSKYLILGSILMYYQVNMLRERNKGYDTIKFVDISSDEYSPEENQGLDYKTVSKWWMISNVDTMNSQRLWLCYCFMAWFFGKLLWIDLLVSLSSVFGAVEIKVEDTAVLNIVSHS